MTSQQRKEAVRFHATDVLPVIRYAGVQAAKTKKTRYVAHSIEGFAYALDQPGHDVSHWMIDKDLYVYFHHAGEDVYGHHYEESNLSAK